MLILIIMENHTEIKGAIHIHTTYSDGSSDIEDVIKTAQNCELDFIIITDHDTLKAREEGFEGYHNDLLVIVGYELTPPEDHHYLVLGLDRVIENKEPETFVDEVKENGGVGIITHPDHTGIIDYGLPQISWKKWSLDKYSGISVWDLMTDIQSKITSPFSLIWSVFNPVSVLRGPKEKTLSRWDRLNKNRSITGICELDNHGLIIGKKPLSFEIFPNNFAFKTLRNHLNVSGGLSGKGIEDIDKVISTIEKGNLFMGFDYFHDTTGFKFFCKKGEEIIKMGDRKRLTDEIDAFILLPENGIIRLLKDGKPISVQFSNYLREKIYKKGVYRVEVFKGTIWGLKPWIYSNPIVFY
jgi:hypothetical protein